MTNLNATFERTYQVSTPQLCRLSRKILGLRGDKLDNSHRKSCVCISDRHPVDQFTIDDGDHQHWDHKRFVKPALLRKIVWRSTSGKEFLTAWRDEEGNWQLHYQGPAILDGKNYYTMLVEVVPKVNPLASLYAHLRAAAQARFSSKKARRGFIQRTAAQLAKATSPVSALHGLEGDADLFRILSRIPVADFATGHQRLRTHFDNA